MGVPKYRLENFKPTKVGGQYTQTTILEYTLRALLASQGHRRTKSGYVESGSFYTVKTEVTHPGIRNGMKYEYNGIKENLTIGGVVGLSYPSLATLTASYGYPSYAQATTGHTEDAIRGYGKFMPGKPQAGLGQFLIELRDLPSIPFNGTLGSLKRNGKYIAKWFAKPRNPFRGIPFQRIPHVMQQRARQFLPDNIGGEYLNYAFGWRPFVNDLRQMYNLWKTVDKRMAQLIRENGKWIRRRGTLDNDTSTEVLADTVYQFPFANVYGAPLAFQSGTTDYKVQRITSTRRWYSSQFRYYIPDIGSSQWNAKARIALFGALPTPELVWNIMPWSWLFDWFSDAGDYLSAVSPGAVGFPVTRNQCVMTHTTTTTEATAFVSHGALHNAAYNWDAFGGSFRSKLKVESKVRSGGYSPYGKGVDWPSFSNSQVAILAALGVSRGSR